MFQASQREETSMTTFMSEKKTIDTQLDMLTHANLTWEDAGPARP
jgi:hypothetical protein